ncbi:MAG: hydrogenase maturation protease [Dehalococcoidia bacterium]|nr:MAG: hydrogenase maturation protease [Dehalococcoidia bacterium]
MSKILICGLGNILKRDDGLGSCVISELEKRALPDNINLIDYGTSGFKCALGIGDYDKVVFVDAIQMGKKPGQTYKINLSKKDLLDSPSLSSFVVSLHESDLERILTTAAILDCYPNEVVIIGCEPADTSYGVGLSEILTKGFPKVINLILKEAS